MKLSIFAGVAALSCIVVAACSSSSNKGSAGGGDGGGGGEGGSDGGGDSGSSSGGSKPYFGSMTASKNIIGANTLYTISGGFVNAPDAAIPDASAAAACPSTGTVSGSCCFLPPAAAPGDAGAADAGTVTFVGAGIITVSDGASAIAAIHPGTNGAYGVTSGANNPSVKWLPGDTLSFSAAGDTVKAFTGTVAAVQDFAGITPALSPTTAVTVPINADFVLKWTAGTATNVRVIVGAFKGTTASGSITCDEADSSGSVTVPTALLSKFATGDGGLVSLTRTTLAAPSDTNATVDLLSTVTTGGTLKFQ